MKKKNEKRSFVMYDSFLEAMKHLNDAEFRECVMKIRDYALDGIDKESESPYVNIILAMAKPNLEAARRRYDACVENGKKGAEYGELGGAPKGNQNARKKQPLKQPLNVEENVYVKVDENEEVNKNSYDNENAPLGSMSSQSSFSSSESSIIDAITLEDADLDGDLSHSKSRSDMTTSSGKSETPSYSKSNSDHNTGSPCIAKAGSSAARRQQNKDEGMDIGEYLEMCFNHYVGQVVNMRLGIIPTDDNVFWKAVDLYKDLHYGIDNQKAANEVSKIVKECLNQDS